MAEEPEELDSQGRWNYFSYYTEVEEHFQKARGSGLFLLSPIDWALLESWKNAGVPLEAVLRGIDDAFEKWHAKKKGSRQVNSVAYCAQAVHEAAEQIASGDTAGANSKAKAPFELEDVRRYLQDHVDALIEREAFSSVVDSLRKILDNLPAEYGNLEGLEQRLSALEEKMSSLAKSSQTEEELLAARRELDSALRPYRGKMTADQLAMLERQFLEKRALEQARLPRLSLFYLQI